LGPLSVLVGRATGPITRRLAGESAAEYRAVIGGAVATRSSLLLVGLAWLVALIPWFVACVVVDSFGGIWGKDRGWFSAITLAGLAAITATAIYYGLRAFLAHEPIKVRGCEDGVPVIAFVLALAILLRA
jgi:hypothetical protein